MRRRVLNVLTFLSLALLVGVVTFGVRSHLSGDGLRWYRPPQICEVMSRRGLVCVGWGQLDAMNYGLPLGWRGTFWPFRPESNATEGDLRAGTTFGFGYERWKLTPGLMADTRRVTFPYWLPTLVFAALPVMVIARHVCSRRKGRRKGMCAACGYDLRATPGRCPECGAPASATTAL